MASKPHGGEAIESSSLLRNSDFGCHFGRAEATHIEIKGCDDDQMWRNLPIISSLGLGFS